MSTNWWHVCPSSSGPRIRPYPRVACSCCRNGIDIPPLGLPEGYQVRESFKVEYCPDLSERRLSVPTVVRLERIHISYPTYPGWVRLYPCGEHQHYFAQPPVLPQPEEGTLRAQVRDGCVDFFVDVS